MSYVHRRWENRVFLYGYVGQYSSYRVEEIPEGEKTRQLSHCGFYLKVTESRLRNGGRAISTLWYCKGYSKCAELLKLDLTSPKWVGLEGRLRAFQGNMKGHVEGKVKVFIEVLRYWTEDAEGRYDATVIVSKNEWERLKRIEAGSRTGGGRFKVPLEKQEELQLKVFDTDDDPNYPEAASVEGGITGHRVPVTTPEALGLKRPTMRHEDGVNGMLGGQQDPDPSKVVSYGSVTKRKRRRRSRIDGFPS